MSPFHQQRFRIRAYETDPEGRLQAHILCKLLQEAATVHAAELGVSVESLREIGVAWVLSYLHLHVEKWPGSDAEIVVKTWPEAANRLFIERRFEVLDPDSRVMATATTVWLVIDLKKRRPVRLPGAIAEAVERHEVGSRPMRPEKLDGPDPADREVVFTVRRSDLDLADHVNNTNYVEWAIEAGRSMCYRMSPGRADRGQTLGYTAFLAD